MSDPKIVFKSDVPEEALISLAMFMMEEMERFIESDIGKEEFERLMREASRMLRFCRKARNFNYRYLY